MKVQPVSSPNDIKTAPGPDLKARAVAAFNQANQQPPTQVVQNQNAISSEELGAIIPQQSQQVDKTTQEETVQEATPETVEEVKTPKETQDPALSRQFAQLARQEKAHRARVQQQDQAIKAREAALQAREAELTAKNTQYTPDKYVSLEDLNADPLRYINYDDVTQRVLNQSPKDPRMEAHISRLEAKIAQLEKTGQDTQKSYADQQSQAYQAAVKQIALDAKSLVKSDPNFETIRATGSINDVVELITETYDKEGVLLTVEEAAQQVEDYLVEEALKFTNIDKIKKKLGLAQAQATKTQTPSPTKQTQPMRTLTNATSSTRPLSAKERAILAFEGKLKS